MKMLLLRRLALALSSFTIALPGFQPQARAAAIVVDLPIEYASDGFALAGWATDRVGASTVFLIGGFSTIALALLGLSHPAVRNLD